MEIDRATPAITRDLGRYFALLWFGHATSKLGSAVTTVVMPLIAISVLGSSTFMITVLEASVWLPWLLIGLPAGAWVDRMRRRRTMMTCDAVAALALATVPVAAWFGVLTMTHLIAVALVLGTAAVFFATAAQAVLPALLPKERLPGANAKLQGTDAGALILGPAVGGAIAQAAGAVSGLLIDAFSFVVSALCLRGIPVPESHLNERARRTTTLREEIGEGMRFVWRDPYLRVFTIHAGVSNLPAAALQAILIVFMVREVGLSQGLVGLVLGAVSVGGVIGALIVTALAARVGTARTILAAELGVTPLALLVPLTTDGWGLVFLLVGGLTVSVAIVASNVLIGSFTQAYTPAPLMGRVAASQHFVNFSTLPIGAVLGGAVAELAGLRTTMWIITSMAVLSGLILLAGPLRKNKFLPTEPAAVPPAEPPAGPPANLPEGPPTVPPAVR
ncbi:MFS transporter [Nonomuraea sp. NPDC050404]|uniref:MFS transporter n=1 Tax=Nonomuraea sp. NPDC050404 TaxID=3155783 RepID=UPI0033BFDAFF